MERDQTPASIPPSFMSSNGRVHDHDKGHNRMVYATGMADTMVGHSQHKKDKHGHSSPRPHPNGHSLSNGRMDNIHNSEPVQLNSHTDTQTPHRVGRTPPQGRSSWSQISGHCQAIKHRPVNKKSHLDYVHTRRTYCSRPNEKQLLERSVVGCESGESSKPNNDSASTLPAGLGDAPSLRSGDTPFSRSGDVPLLQPRDAHSSLSGNTHPSQLRDAPSSRSGGAPLSRSGDVSPSRPGDAPASRTGHAALASNTNHITGDNTHVPRDQAGASVNSANVLTSSLLQCSDHQSLTFSNYSIKCEHSKMQYNAGCTNISSRSTQASTMSVDYPILGTMSALTNKMAYKRSVGPVDEVPFVFGRPASPSRDLLFGRPASPSRDPSAKSGSSQPHLNPGVTRSVSPSQGRYTPGPLRSMSPNSEVIPKRKANSLGGYPDRRVFSPPPVLGVGAAADPRIHHQGGICCEHCNRCLVELKRQALKLMFPNSGTEGHLAQSIQVDNIGQHLTLPDGYERWYSKAGHCGVCETPLSHLKQEAVAMVQSIQLAQISSTPTNLPSLVGSCGHLHQNRSRYHHWRQARLPQYSAPSSMPLAAQAQAYLEQNVRAYINPQVHSQILAGMIPGFGLPLDRDNHYVTQGSFNYDSSKAPLNRSATGQPHHHHQWPGHAHPVRATYTHIPQHSPVRVTCSTASSPLSPPVVPSAAVSFFARAAQKLAKRKKRHHSQDQEPQPTFPTNFSEIIRLTPPAAPPCLLRSVGRFQSPGMGKVKVMLKICHPASSQGDQSACFLSADPRKKQVTVFDPSASGYVTSANRRATTSAPKMFAFDSVVTPDDSLTELCASSLAEIIQAVVAGADGCVLTYGHSKLGKTYTMIGSDQSPGTLGVMPCAISWLFKLINEQKDKTGARFSVRVSAVQVTGKEELLRDLLSDLAQAGAEATGVGTAPSVYLREDPICGTQLENQSELRAPTADKAALYLDAALASCASVDDDDSRSSHLLFTMNVYQYRIEKANTKAGLPAVAGGRSRLHLIDLGTASKSKDPGNVSLSLSALGNVIMALLNGQRHVPHRDSKIAQLLRDSLGNLSCRTCMIAHVSSAVAHYNETLQVVQLAARIHRMKRRRTKFSSTSSEDSSTDGDIQFRRPYRGLKMGTLREDVLYSSSHSDPDYTSSSEQSCDTVIYLGANGQSLSDRELTDNEGPPRHVPRTNPRLPRRPSGSRSSGDDSDSGRSMHSVPSLEFTLASNSLISPSLKAASNCGQPPGSPNPGLLRIGHIVGKSPCVSRGPPSGSSLCSSRWQEKPTKIHCHASQSKIAKAIHEKQQLLEGELWVDGPGSSIYTESKCNEMWVDGPQAFVSQQQHHHDEASNKVDAAEKWIDGPKEMLAGNNPSQPMHTFSKPDLLSKTNCQNKMYVCTKINETALKQSMQKHTKISSKMDCTSVESDQHSVCNFAENVSRNLDQTKTATDYFNTCDLPSVEASSSPMVSTKKQKLSESPKKSYPSKQSPKPSQEPSLLMSSPKPSQDSLLLKSWKNQTEACHVSELHKDQLLSVSASPTHRVVQWIKSVSSEQDVHDPQKTKSCGIHSSQFLNENVSMADAETNTEHDSEFERLAQEILPENEDLMVSSSFNGKCAILHRTGDKFYTELNNESIYEMEVEERLELMKTKDGCHLAAEVDNETFSSVSCSNKDFDEFDRDDGMDSLLIEHTKTLTESKQTAQLARHLEFSHVARNVSRPICDDTTKRSQSLLSRKPDGASNPNLHKICHEEKSVVLGQIGIPVKSMTAMFVSEPGTNFSATSTKCSVTHLEEEDTFCENETNLLSPCITTDISACSTSSIKMSAINKSPIALSKASPTSKQSGHPRSNNSQTSINTSPAHTVYCLAKPTHSPKCSHTNSQKSGKNISLSSPAAKSNFNRCDKSSCTSSTTSHSPQSSATSSPITDLKSSASASSTKASCKSLNGSSISKQPCICANLTSSPSTKDGGKSKKKEKANKHHGHLLSDFVLKGRGNDSDSGNDSGIVTHEKRLLSPYATVTKPRTPSHSSSGHGSDNSTISTEVHPGNPRLCTKTENLHGGTSSGYESMLRDSEATGSSSEHDDSGSESSSQHKKGSKRKVTSRSRPVPVHSPESSPVSSQPSQAGSRSAGPTHQVWIDTRQIYKIKDEPLELKRYDPEEVERLCRRRADEEVKVTTDNKENEGILIQDELGSVCSKDIINAEPSGWSFDCKFFICFSCKSQQRGTDV